MHMNSGNRRKQRIEELQKREKRSRLLHRSSWITFASSAVMLAVLGKERVETPPYIYIAVALVLAAIGMRLLILMPHTKRRGRKVLL